MLPRTSYNVKDDEMEIFSPLMTPITPALNNLWNDSDGAKKDHPILDRKPSFLIPSASQRFPFIDDRSNDHPILGLKSSSSFGQVFYLSSRYSLIYRHIFMSF